MEQKRVSIRKRIRLFVLLVSIVSLLLTAAVGFFSMMKIRAIGKNALVAFAGKNLTQQVRNKADVADAEFAAYANYVQYLADYIHRLYVEAPFYLASGQPVPPPLCQTPPGTYSMQRLLAREDISLAAVDAEMRLLSHLQDFCVPFMNHNGDVVATCYASTKSGIMISYDAEAALAAVEGDREVYYNYFESSWYRQSLTAKKVFFTGVYDDAFDRGLTITCAAPFFDAADSFAGVVCMDILITDLYDKLVSFDVGEGSASFLIDGGGKIIQTEEKAPADGPRLKDSSIPYDHIPVGRLLKSDESRLLAFGSGFYAHARLSSTGWQLCFYMPRQLVFSAAHSTSRAIFLSIIVFLAVFFFVSIAVFLLSSFFSVMITNPVNHLRRDVDLISSGMIVHRADVMRNDEIGDLAAGINQMADALQTYTDVIIEKERLDTELEIAMRIQANMLPSVEKEFPLGHKDFELAASMTPAKEIGGDFYDFFLIDSDHIALVIADVAGKGVPAALLMVTAKTMIKSQTLAAAGPEGRLSPADIFNRVNKLLCIDNAADLFVSAWLGILELSTGKLVGTNAGHENPALKRTGMRYEFVRTEHNPPLGSLSDITYTEHATTLMTGDRLFLYTDGLLEAKNAEEEEFGSERLLALLNQNLLTRPEALVKAVKAAASDFASNLAQYDDITLLSFYYERR